MSRIPLPKIAKSDLDRLRTFRILPNLLKIPLFIGLMVGMSYIAWFTDSTAIRWAMYIGLGYMWMGMVTFMHDALHDTLFRSKLANWIFGIVCMIPIFASFVAFRADHIEHHRHNRSPKDPDAFTMGHRRFADFLVFYAYAAIGGVLSFVHFNFIYPFQRFTKKEWAIQIFETVLKVGVYWAVLAWAAQHDVLGKALGLWLYPVLVLSLLNSMRFIAEHYGAPWDAGQMAGTRTVISNPVNSFFWNNINWHIGHHVYPSVPWYNLVELHRILEPQIKESGAPVDKSYMAVYFKALMTGPELLPAQQSEQPAVEVKAAAA